MAIGIILGIIIGIIAIVAIAFAIGSFDECEDVKGWVCTIIAIVAVLSFIIVPFSFHTIQTGEVAVVKHLGEITDTKTAGTYFDFWMINKYVTYDAKVQDVPIETAAYSSDAQTMNIQMTMQYKIREHSVVDIATQYGTLKNLRSRIESITTEKTKSVLSSYKAMDIIANRASISPAVEKAVKEAIGDEYYVDVVAVVLTNIDFSDAFEQAVEDKMIAEQTKLKAEYDNETKIAKAEAEAAAKLKEAQAAIEIAKAEAEAMKIEADGKAAANKIIAESITNNIITTQYIEKWNGELPKYMGSDGNVLIGMEE